MNQPAIWKIIDSHFQDNPQSLVRHHVDSFNDFYKTSIFSIFKEKNPVRLSSLFLKQTGEYKHECNLYFGGKRGNKLYFGKPVIYDEANAHYMFPNEARLRNMTYGMTIHYDVEVEFITRLEPGEKPAQLGSSLNEESNEGKSENFKTNPENAFEDPLKQSEPFIQEGGAPKPTTIKKKTKNLQDIDDSGTTPSQAATIQEKTTDSLSEDGRTQTYTITLENVYLGKFPIMVQSDFCILQGVPREVRHTMGECKNDIGGYFIIDGKEKTVVAQEKFADNMLYIRKYGKEDEEEELTTDKYLYSAEIRSVSENVSKPIRTMSVKMVAPSPSYNNRNIVVNLPNVRKPVPLFILFRALGILSDKEIISYCLLDLDKYENMVDLFIPSVHDAANILTQTTALEYIASLTKGKTVNDALEIISDYFLPHIGEINYIPKAYYLGNMVFRLLSVATGLERPTDRDNFKYKRVELVGSLLYDLFREYWNIQLRQVHLEFEKAMYYDPAYENDLKSLILKNYREVFKERTLEQGFRKAFKGNWGAQTHTKRVGVIQDINRLSFNSYLNHLRKTSLPLDSGVKLVGPRVLHNSQWGFIDPIDTPDGANIGLHKHLAISTYVTKGTSREPLIEWLREKWGMKLVEEFSPKNLAQLTKVIVNGCWIGTVNDPIECVKKFKLYRRNALIPIFMSASFEIGLNSIFIYTDAGRLCRPIFYKDGETGKASYENKEILKQIDSGDFSWDQLITGFNEKSPQSKYDAMDMRLYALNELYDDVKEETNPAKLDRFIKKKAILDYIDASESETSLIALNYEEFEQGIKGTESTEESRLEKRPDKGRKLYTHCEIHESLLFGMMCNMIIFPENNPASRNSFSCGQSKQACSLYHTNYQVRMDKTATVLNYGQIPLVKSRYLEHIQHEENSYGENAIVAIMCYTGYNVEDAILINEGALGRGLFRTSYFTTYEAHEESSKTASSTVDIRFTNIESDPLVIGTKPGYDYSKLDKHGIIREGTLVDDKTVLIGLTSVGNPPAGSAVIVQPQHIDGSKTPKKGQLGIVDKTFITEGEEGYRLAKVRILEQRIPAIGDKMASRAGQKGTIGLVIPERDMPFTKDGIRPDIIINPHAIPTRMTIGQLVECITGKACAHYGGFGDCTAFVNKGSKIGVFGELLTKVGFHSSGNEQLYNGMTGEQIESEIFMGPTYYMRLKHMVKDKINFRALGPRTALTKQPVSGRANDGGLRIGEMERDSIISHGATDFLRESMMERGDKYYLAICNQTGMMSIYNPSRNLFMSPMSDGPLKFTGSFEGSDLRIENITRFGRNFSVVCIPYSLKLLIQELQTINVQMRIITEDNLEQMENMSFSKNIEHLTYKKDASPMDLINMIKEQVTTHHGKVFKIPSGAFTPEASPTFPLDVSPAYQPSPSELGATLYGENSPVYNPIDSPAYNPNYSPAYNPNDSPAYNPNDSPAYNPNSPGSVRYSPHSPEGPPPINIDENSPDFSTWKQQNATPPESEMKSGGSSEEKGFQVGGRVHIRGRPDAARPWKISRLGDKFVTLMAEDKNGLHPDEHIKIVRPNEIYDAGNVIPANPFLDPRMMMHQHQHQPPQFGNMMQPQAAPVNITFAPKLINGGNDNSTAPEVAPVSFTQTQPSGETNFGMNLPPLIVPKNVHHETKHDHDKKEGGAGELDFNKGLFIVKKS
jgi:DNA-directed RNA polymerase II subunit RPB2